MPVLVHFIDVGQGNMALIQAGQLNVVCDCNIREDNAQRVLGEVAWLLPPSNRYIDVFINTHRDADHMAGIERLDRAFPIRQIWDAGAAGGTTDSPEYRAYMGVRRNTVAHVLQAGQVGPLGPATIRVLHGATEGQPDDCNRESVVFKLEHAGKSVLFAGDCDTVTWKRIVATVPAGVLDSSVLVAPHHGASRCLEDRPVPEVVRRPPALSLRGYGAPPVTPLSALQRMVGTTQSGGPYAGFIGTRPRTSGLTAAFVAAERAIRSAQAPHYIEHLKLIRPYVTIISVGRDNSYGHPSGEALWLYREHSVGIPVVGLANQFIKVARTDEMGTIFLTMSDDPAARGWSWRNPDAQ